MNTSPAFAWLRNLARSIIAFDWALAAIAGVAIAALWIIVALLTVNDFTHQAEETERDTSNFALALEAQVAGRFDAIDSTLRAAQHFYTADPEHFALADWAVRGTDRVNAIVTDAKGVVMQVLHGARAKGIDLHDNAAIAGQIASGGADRLLISPPIFGRVSARNIITATRPLHDAQGRFIGVMVLSIDNDTFSSLYRALDLPHGAITLFGLDDHLIRARYPDRDVKPGMVMPESIAGLLAGGRTQASLQHRSPFDGVERFVVARRVAQFPLAVAVSFDVEAMRAEPRGAAINLAVAGVLVTVMIAAIAFALSFAGRAGRRAHAAIDAAFTHVDYGIIVLDPNMNIAIANERFSALLELPPGLAEPGRPIKQVADWQQRHGEFVSMPQQLTLDDAFGAHPIPEALNYERTRPNGTVLQVRTEALADGSMVRSFADVTVARRAAAAIAAAADQARSAEASLAAALNNVLHGVMMVGEDRRVLFVNARAVDLLCMTPDILHPGVHEDDILRLQVERGDFAGAPEVEARVRDVLLHGLPASPDGSLIRDYQRNTPDGRRVEIRITYLADGRVVTTYTDITAQHAAQRSRAEFLAVVTHELRTPLNGIIGIAELLASGQLSMQQQADLRLIAEAGDQLLGIINDILTVVHFEHGGVAPHEAGFDLTATLREVCDAIAPAAAAKALVLRQEFDPALPPMVRGDRDRLRHLLRKLLDNSVKFTETGTITLSAGVLAHDGGDWRIAITIADTGIGIPQDVIGGLFTPFVQGDSSFSRRFGGLGLGLAICRLLAESLGGSIAAESQPGVGSAFRVELPLRAF